MIDSDFFTRVGLRYINALPTGRARAGWINPVLTSVLDLGVLGDVHDHWTEVRGFASGGGEYSLRYGYPPQAGKDRDYVIDLDFYALSVDVDDLFPLLDRFSREAHNLFEWCIGDQARDAMRTTSTRK